MVYSSKILTETFSNVKSASDIIYETETNWNTLVKAVSDIAEESREKYGEVIYEAVNLKAFFGKIKEFFKGLLEKIKKWFKNIIDKIKNLFSKNERTFKNVDISKLKRPSHPVTINTYAYKNLDHTLNYDFSYHLKKIGIPDIMISIGDLNSASEFEELIGSKYKIWDHVDTDNLGGRIRASLLGLSDGSNLDHNTYIKKLTEFFGCGDDDDTELSSEDIDIKECIKIATDDKYVSKVIKICNEQEHAIYEDYRKIDNIRGDAQYSVPNSSQSRAIAMLIDYFNLLKNFHTDIVEYDRIWLSAIMGYFNANSYICTKIAEYNHINHVPHYYTNA